MTENKISFYIQYRYSKWCQLNFILILLHKKNNIIWIKITIMTKTRSSKDVSSHVTENVLWNFSQEIILSNIFLGSFLWQTNKIAENREPISAETILNCSGNVSLKRNLLKMNSSTIIIWRTKFSGFSGKSIIFQKLNKQPFQLVSIKLWVRVSIHESSFTFKLL